MACTGSGRGNRGFAPANPCGDQGQPATGRQPVAQASVAYRIEDQFEIFRHDRLQPHLALPPTIREKFIGRRRDERYLSGAVGQDSGENPPAPSRVAIVGDDQHAGVRPILEKDGQSLRFVVGRGCRTGKDGDVGRGDAAFHQHLAVDLVVRRHDPVGYLGRCRHLGHERGGPNRPSRARPRQTADCLRRR